MCLYCYLEDEPARKLRALYQDGFIQSAVIATLAHDNHDVLVPAYILGGKHASSPFALEILEKHLGRSL